METATSKGQLLVALEKNRNVLNFFGLLGADKGFEIKKLNMVELPPASLEFSPLNVHLLSNGAALTLGYQYEPDNDILSYAAVVALLEDPFKAGSSAVFTEVCDVVPLSTSEYPEKKTNAEFKVLELPLL